MTKASIEEIVNLYKIHESVWKVAQKLGMCGQSIHERLKKINYPFKGRKFSLQEDKAIREAYSQNFLRGDSPIKKLSLSLSRPYPNVVRRARELGVTNPRRTLNDELKNKTSTCNKKWHQENAHPKGMLGKTHSETQKKEMKVRMKKRWSQYTLDQINEITKKTTITSRLKGNYNRPHGNWKAAWRTIGGKKKFFRSRWEANYARYLEFIKHQDVIKDWEHEPQTFWFDKIKRGVRSYLPDFKVTNKDGTHYWVEVKGWMCPRSKTCISRFNKYYPEEKLIVVDGRWFKKNNGVMRALCKDWEER